MSDPHYTNATDLIMAIRKAFNSAEAPASKKQLSEIYGVLAAQQEALFSVYALAIKANPEIFESTQAEEARDALRICSEAFQETLNKLAESKASDGDQP